MDDCGHNLHDIVWTRELNAMMRILSHDYTVLIMKKRSNRKKRVVDGEGVGGGGGGYLANIH